MECEYHSPYFNEEAVGRLTYFKVLMGGSPAKSTL
jgi:hypothetical protein